jgi:phosphopentomutase
MQKIKTLEQFSKSNETYTNVTLTEHVTANNNLPVLFNKKSQKTSIIKPLTHINNDTGKTRHYTPAAQE